MSLRVLAASIAVATLAGCASVSMESPQASDAAKKFAPPSPGMAGVYLYRSGSLGAALKKDVWINGQCVGETASNVFFYKEVPAGEHKISTESEFSPNDLVLKAVAGVHYFVKQFIKFGVFVGGAGLEQVDEAVGKKEIADLKLAKGGTCSK